MTVNNDFVLKNDCAFPQETLAQRNALLERLLAMQQQAAAQLPTPTGTRADIEGQQDAWWLDKQMKVCGDSFAFQEANQTRD